MNVKNKEKITTCTVRMKVDVKRQVKLYAIAHDMNVAEVLEDAILKYLGAENG